MTVQIGNWVQRERGQVAHYVESIVAEDAVTRCGRRLSNEPTRTGYLSTANDEWRRRCKTCLGPAT